MIVWILWKVDSQKTLRPSVALLQCTWIARGKDVQRQSLVYLCGCRCFAVLTPPLQYYIALPVLSSYALFKWLTFLHTTLPVLFPESRSPLWCSAKYFSACWSSCSLARVLRWFTEHTDKLVIREGYLFGSGWDGKGRGETEEGLSSLLVAQ